MRPDEAFGSAIRANDNQGGWEERSIKEHDQGHPFAEMNF
jgi:hypothetical protein